MTMRGGDGHRFSAAGSWISIHHDEGGHFDGYLAVPPSASGPGLLLLQEIWGVNDHIMSLADEFAAAGFVVLAPDMYWRAGRRISLSYGPADTEKARALYADVDFDRARKDLVSSASLLSGLTGEAERRIGAVGYCFGGRLAFLAAADHCVTAAVSYYGSGLGEHESLLSSPRGPMLFHFAENDHLIPLEEVDRWIPPLARGGPLGVHVYAGRRHGFDCPFRDAYSQPDAELAKARTLAFLREHL